MPRLKFDQLEQLAREAGFDPSVSPKMAAIALAESGGNPRAHNPRYPDNSYGLMQVNMLDEPGYQLGASRRKRYGLNSNEDLFDPVTNFKAAKDIYDSQGLDAWAVHSSGAYKNFLPNSFTPLQGQSQSSVSPEAGGLRMAAQDGGPLALAMANINKEFGLTEKAQTSPLAAAMNNVNKAYGLSSAPAAATATSQTMPVSTGGGVGIVDLGRGLQGMGFKVAEHPEFGGVGKHSDRSHHYSGHALDLTIQPGSELLAGRPDSDWLGLTSEYGEALRKRFPNAEIFHPGYDPVGGHNSHIHIAFPGGTYG